MNIEPLTFEAFDKVLRGTLYLPNRHDDEVPVALLFHGFGGNRIEGSRFFVRLARRLVAKGIAVVSYDRAGHGESDGDFFDTTVTRDIKDAQEVLAAIEGYPFADRNNIHIVGYSLGGVVAAGVAAEASNTVRSLTLISPAAIFVDDIRKGVIQGKSLSSLKSKGYFDFYGDEMGKKMIEDAGSFDVYQSARGFEGKVLIMQGTNDFIPLSYAERYKKVYGDNATLLIRDGADHGWATVPDREYAMSHVTRFVCRNAFPKA